MSGWWWKGGGTEVNLSKAGALYLNFGGRFPHHTFAVMIPRQGAERGRLDGLKKRFEGKRVQVSRKVEQVRGKPQMEVRA